MENVREALAAMQKGGIEVMGWGSVDPEISHRAGYDFYAVYRLQNKEQVRAFEEAVEEAGTTSSSRSMLAASWRTHTP